MVDELSYTFPNTTSRVHYLATMYKPIVSTRTSKGFLPNGFVSTSVPLPLVLTCTTNTCISSASMGGECCDTIWDNSIFIAFFNSCLIISKLHLFFSSTFLLHASWRFLFSSSTSFLHSSLRLPMMSTNGCWVIDAEEVLEPCEACPKYWLIVTLILATRTRPGCYGWLITMFNMSSWPCGTKLPYIVCSSKESCEQHNMDLHLNVHSYETINWLGLWTTDTWTHNFV